MNKVFYPSVCKVCSLLYQPVTWLRFRVDGYCDKDCVPRFKIGAIMENGKIEDKTRRLLLAKLIENGAKGVTYLDFDADSGINDGNIAQLVASLSAELAIDSGPAWLDA